MFRNVLVACDGSEPSSRAFDYAHKLAHACGGHIEVIYVITTPLGTDIVELKAEIEEGGTRAERIFRRLAFRAPGQGADVEFRWAVGQPADRIVTEAVESNADLIVMGYPHLSVLDRCLNWSTALRVMERARRPILMVP